MLIRWIVEALLRPEVLNAIGRIVGQVIKGENADQLALIRSDLGRLEARMRDELDGIRKELVALEQRVLELEKQGARRRSGDLPGPPPPLPGG